MCSAVTYQCGEESFMLRWERTWPIYEAVPGELLLADVKWYTATGYVVNERAVVDRLIAKPLRTYYVE